MNSPQPPKGNENDESAEAQAKVDVIMYTAKLVDDHGFDADMVSYFIDSNNALGLKAKQRSAVYTALSLEDVLRADGDPLSSKYAHLSGRKSGVNRGIYAKSEDMVEDSLFLVGTDANSMSRTEVARTGSLLAAAMPRNIARSIFRPKELAIDDQRARKIVANVAQMEIICNILRQVDTIKVMGSRRAGINTQILLNESVGDLHQLQPEKTLQLIADMTVLVRQHLSNEKDQNLRSIYMASLDSFAFYIDYIARYKIFDGFGTGLLTDSETTNDPESAQLATDEPQGIETTGEENVEPTVEQEIILETPAEVLSQMELISNKIDAFNRHWFDIGRKWRENGFSGLMEDLVRSKHGFDKVYSPKIIGLLARINASAEQSQHQAIEEYKAAREQGSSLKSDVASFIANYGKYPEVKKFARSMFMINIAEEANDIQQRWSSGLASSIRAQWPNYDGASAAQRIQNVLFHDGQSLYEETNTSEGTGVEHDVLLDTGEIDTLRDLIEQLDEIILPPGMTEVHLIQQLRDLGVEHPDEINWEKFKDLIEITKEFGGKIYRSKIKSRKKKESPKVAKGDIKPDDENKAKQNDAYGKVYYVAVFDLYGKRFAVAESPLIKNATYVIDETHTPGSWIEMLALYKDQVRDLGGKQIIHSSTSPYGPAHRKKIIDHIFKVSAEQ
jgi:hypothetical protein